MSQIQRSNEDLLLEQQNSVAELQTLNTNGAKESKQDTAISILQDIEANTQSSSTGKEATVSALTSVAASTSSVSLLAANADRVEAIVRNDSNQELYIVLGATATTSAAIKLKKDDVFVIEKYTGAISGIWDTGASGFARIEETTTV